VLIFLSRPGWGKSGCRQSLDFIAKLAALVPRPRVNLVRYHGVFAPNSKLRRRIIPAKNSLQPLRPKHKDQHQKETVNIP